MTLPSAGGRSTAQEIRPHYPTERGRFAKHFDKDDNPSETVLMRNRNDSKTGAPCRSWRVLFKA